MTAREYEALPEDISRTIEIVDGYVVLCEAPSPAHQKASRRLATLIEEHARVAMKRGHGPLAVDNSVDVRLRDVPLSNLRSDVVLYRCPDRDRGERLRAGHVLLVAEVVSPGSETRDSTGKPGVYAKAGIPNYWIVRLDDTGVSIIERYRLDHASRLYKHVGTFMKDEGGKPEVSNPISLTIDWQDLEF
ncbi:Uma2 family endonuclease [Spirillospora sp. NPDC047279]|uniref:Uma2 family endonuclease n=1 Tax=Spirillospora sp. NPDC047279 TaxID=3155478 RepID=UPI0033FBD8C1